LRRYDLTNKSADIATAHVSGGCSSFVNGALAGSCLQPLPLEKMLWLRLIFQPVSRRGWRVKDCKRASMKSYRSAIVGPAIVEKSSWFSVYSPTWVKAR